MGQWETLLATEIAKLMGRVLPELSFTRLCWLRENIDTVSKFLRGDLDMHLKGVVSPMPLKEIDAETYMAEREFSKSPDAP